MNALDSTRHRPGAIVLAVVLAAIALLLLAMIGQQTKWIEGVKLIAQPRFWPGLCLLGMLLFSAGFAVSLRRSTTSVVSARTGRELLLWLRPLEYAVYFMVYVFAVGKLGYLVATVIFCPALVWRCGYRRLRYLTAAIGFGIAVVLFFKTFLRIKIPGGELYDLFPDVIRNFMILYF